VRVPSDFIENKGVMNNIQINNIVLNSIFNIQNNHIYNNPEILKDNEETIREIMYSKEYNRKVGGKEKVRT